MKPLAFAAAAFATSSAAANFTYAPWNSAFSLAPTGNRVNATSCNSTAPQTTVYEPTTVTITTVVYAPSSAAPAEAAISSSSTTSPVLSITTVEYTATTTINVAPTALIPHSGLYTFVVNDGTTSWIDGQSPDTNKPIDTATSSVTLIPVPSSSAGSTTFTTITTTSTLTSTTTAHPGVASGETPPLETFTALPITSTVISQSPDSTTTMHSTRYSTITMSRVSSLFSFAGTNSDGWNTTSTQRLSDSSTTLPQPITTTETQLVILNVSSITATSTAYLTTTVGAVVTQTFYPSVIAPGLSTLDAEPVTVTHTVQNPSSAPRTSLPLETSTTAVNNAPAPIVPASASNPVSITTTTYAPSALPPSAAPVSEAEVSTGNSSGTSPLSSTASVLGLSSVDPTGTLVTLTSFLNGQGTTLTVYSTTAGTTPMSPGFNSTSSLESLATTTTLVDGHRTTLTVTAPSASTMTMYPSSNRTTSSQHQSPSLTSDVAPVDSSSSSLQPTNPNGSAAPTTLPGSQSSAGRSSTVSLPSSSLTRETTPTPSQSLTTQVVSLSNVESATPSITRASSSSSFSNPFPPHSATATPSAGCGEQGNFTLTFDDLPRFMPSKRQSWNQSANATDIGLYPPVTFGGRPYHHLYFSDGYVYAPKPAEPYTPASHPNVAAFADPMRTGWSRNSTGKNNVEPGEVGDAYRDDSPAFWFDMQGAYLGCDNPGPEECVIEATAYAWDPNAEDEVQTATHNYTIPPCQRNCTMQQVNFSPAFRQLTGIQFRAIVDSEPRTFYVDEMSMRWSNSSCEAGMMRQESR